MLMWYAILGFVVMVSGIAFIYVSNQVAKFDFIIRLSYHNKRIGRAIGISIVMLIFGGLWLTINLMNAVICVVYLAVFWFLSKFIFKQIQKTRKRLLKYDYAGIAAIIFSVVFLGYGWYLDHQVWMTSYVIKTEKNIKNFKIIHFADSHIGTTFNALGFAKHIDTMMKQSPDMIVITGDFVDDNTSRQEMLEVCRKLGEIKVPYGVYFAFGNHDKGYYDPAKRGFSEDDLIAELKKNNVTVLQDEAVLVDDRIYIIGRKDFSEIQWGSQRMDMDKLIENLDKNKFMIVLDHQPNNYDDQEKSGVDLVLSGHTHGGQLWPFNKVGEWIGANDRTYGWERRHKTNFIVTSGLSDWAIKFKMGTKSEFVVINVEKEEKSNYTATINANM